MIEEMQRLNTITILTLFVFPMLSFWGLELWLRKTNGQKKFLGLEIVLNLFILTFYSLLMWKAYNPFTTESVLVSGLLAVQLFKTIREIVSMVLEVFWINNMACPLIEKRECPLSDRSGRRLFCFAGKIKSHGE